MNNLSTYHFLIYTNEKYNNILLFANKMEIYNLKF